MKEKFINKLKQNRAFTLTEMLIALAIMVVLLGISIVAFNDWTKSLEMTELDYYAESIYMEAQTQLASMETEGSLETIYNNLVVEGGTYYEEYHSRQLTEMPTDYDFVQNGDAYRNLFYFTGEDGITHSFIPSTSITNDCGGGYLLELNPESGDVYGVFYWKDTNEEIQTYLAAYGTDGIYDLIQDSSKMPDRSRDGRKKLEIGYYGGGVTKTVAATDYQLNQKVELVNDEELYVKISYDYRGRMLTYRDPIGTTLKIRVNIQGEESGATWLPEINIVENDYVNAETKRLETGLLLDGVRAGEDFKSRMASMGFIPGENLLINVETRFVQGNVDIIEQSETKIVNSLFDGVDKDAGVHTITLAKVRHLRNLDATYYPENVTDSVAVVLNKELDFSQGKYAFDEDGYYVGTIQKPIAAIAPIENDSLFINNTMGRTVTVKGNDYLIKNLVVSAPDGASDVGLFARTKNVNFENIKLEGLTVNASGCTNVGALVGNLQGGTLDRCGVYLMPYYKDASGTKHYYSQEPDNEYGSVMTRRYATIGITGEENVGSLVGSAKDASFFHCYGAEQVQGENVLGGFIGNAKNVAINNCYASGNVRQLSDAGKIIGGFVGKADNVTVNQAYTTGNIYAANTTGNIIGGFIGNSVYSHYQACATYGEVLCRDGSDKFRSDLYVGGMLSLRDVNYGNSQVEGSNFFLKQVGYNTSAVFDDALILAANYNELADRGGSHSTAASFPYDGNLLYKAFPFAAVTDSHYGNWPLSYFINTSLAYYEKYGDGSYGYYSATTIKDTGDAEKDSYVWVVDSLRDETCVEDGYALLSMYYLDNFDYVTYQYKEDTDGNRKWLQNDSGNLSIRNHYTPGREDEEAVLLRQQGFLEFRAYEKPVGENAYTADYSTKIVKDAFTMSGMYLYQLPYELQCTDRYSVYNFYDRLVIYDGYAKGNTGEGAQPVVGGKTIAEGETFFYCPHFSKTAVNPGMGVAENATIENPDTVFVRSARQLNALGRMPYYWNKKGGAIAMSYEQEVDIDFGSYTNLTKEYCGKEFNLLAFDQPYSNQPIGDWDRQAGGYGSFQNDYNGKYHKIIDYCVKSDKQYVGLFGEIYKTGGATRSQIQNIVMVVSDSKHRANYLTASSVKEQNNAGLIMGTFEDTTGKSGNNRLRAGVGALVGSDYTIGKTDGDASVFTIFNCAVSGYQVQYHVNTPTHGGQQPLGIALGGMVGYSRGNIAQSTAANDVTLVLNDSIVGNNAAALVGGFAGSCYYGTILNCYSGGTIDVEDYDTYGITRLRIAGFCPGWLDAPGISNNHSSEMIRYQNIYTYTQVLDSVWGVRENPNERYTFDHLIPVVGRMFLVYERRMTGILKWETKWHTDSENGSSTGVRVPGFAYYLTQVYPNVVSKSGADKYFVDSGSQQPKTCDPATYTQLQNKNWLKSNRDFGNEVRFIPTSLYSDIVYTDAAHSYYYDKNSLQGKTYPFPVVVKDAEGNYVHYGDWPLN